jgi:hypothetical protein
VLSGYTKLLAPFHYVYEPFGWSIGIQPSVRRNAIDYDCGIPENAQKEFVILAIDALNVVFD